MMIFNSYLFPSQTVLHEIQCVWAAASKALCVRACVRACVNSGVWSVVQVKYNGGGWLTVPPESIHILAMLLLHGQLFCRRLWNPDLFTGRATCPRPAVFNPLETAVEILWMTSYEKPTDIYSWSADLLHPRQPLCLLLFDHASHLWTFEHLGHVLL